LPIADWPLNDELACFYKLAIGNRQSAIEDQMYRRPKFLEVLHAIREDMSREADYDVDLFAEMVRSGVQPTHGPQRVIRGFRTRAPRAEASNGKRKVKPTKHRQQPRGAQ
jgi:hypothetical protein